MLVVPGCVGFGRLGGFEGACSVNTKFLPLRLQIKFDYSIMYLPFGVDMLRYKHNYTTNAEDPVDEGKFGDHKAILLKLQKEASVRLLITYQCWFGAMMHLLKLGLQPVPAPTVLRRNLKPKVRELEAYACCMYDEGGMQACTGMLAQVGRILRVIVCVC